MSTHPGERVTDGRIVDPSASPDTSGNPSSDDRKSPPPLPLTSDPLSVLGLDAGPTSYPSGYIPSTAVKRAYRQRTAQYHPDAILSPDSTKEERQRANDDFARITAAYEAAVAQQVQYQIRTDADITTTEVGGTTIGVGINVFAYDFERKKEELDRAGPRLVLLLQLERRGRYVHLFLWWYIMLLTPIPETSPTMATIGRLCG